MITNDKYKHQNVSTPGGNTFRCALMMFSELRVGHEEFHGKGPVEVEAIKSRIQEDLERAMHYAIYDQELQAPIREAIIIMQRHLVPPTYLLEPSPWVQLEDLLKKLQYKASPIVHAKHSGVDPRINGE